MTPQDKTLFNKIFGFPFEDVFFTQQNHLQKLVLVQYLTGMEIREFPSISFEHPRGNNFKKYRSQDLAPVRFTHPNFNHRDWGKFYPTFNVGINNVLKGSQLTREYKEMKVQLLSEIKEYVPGTLFLNYQSLFLNLQY